MEARSTYNYSAAVTAVKNGDMDAFETLYNESIPAFRRQVMKYLKNEADAEDVLQEVYIRIFNSINTLEDPSSFLSWGLKICTNLSINRIRSMHGKKNDFDLMPNTSDEDTMGLEDIPAESYRAEFNPEASMDEKETARLMREIVDDLPEIQRLCIMGWQEKITAKELASELGISENSVYVSINQGKKKIKAKVLELEKQGTKLYGMAPLTFFLWIMDIYDASFVPAKPAFAGVSSFAEITARIRESIPAPDGTGSVGTGHGITSQILQQGEAGTGTGHILQGQGAGNPSSSATGGNNMDMQGTHMGTSSASSSSGSAIAGKEQAAAKTAAGAAKGGAAKGTAGVISKVVVTRIVTAVIIVSVVIGGITVFRRVTKTTKEETVTETTTTTSETHDEDENENPKVDNPAEFLQGLGLEYIGNKEIIGEWIISSKSMQASASPEQLLSGCVTCKISDFDNDDADEILCVSVDNQIITSELTGYDTYGIILSLYEQDGDAWVKSDEVTYDDYYLAICPDGRVDVFLKDNNIYILGTSSTTIYEPLWCLTTYIYDGTSLDKGEIYTSNHDIQEMEPLYLTGESFDLLTTNKQTLINELDEYGLNVSDVGMEDDASIIEKDKETIPLCRLYGNTVETNDEWYDSYENYMIGKQYDSTFGEFKLQYIDFGNESEVE